MHAYSARTVYPSAPQPERGPRTPHTWGHPPKWVPVGFHFHAASNGSGHHTPRPARSARPVPFVKLDLNRLGSCKEERNPSREAPPPPAPTCSPLPSPSASPPIPAPPLPRRRHGRRRRRGGIEAARAPSPSARSVRFRVFCDRNAPPLYVWFAVSAPLFQFLFCACFSFLFEASRDRNSFCLTLLRVLGCRAARKTSRDKFRSVSA